MRKIRYYATIFGSLLAMGIGGTGCVNIAPWERGILAKPQMELDPHPLQSELQQQSHNYSSREAAPSHKSSSGGGGCGCY
ncbi:uncharacterized protein DUF4266 [Nitrosomonas oligotropha]|uniref:Uncharacterized protein DUF4266 n=1 Tax=Nitrosomonas oligotropha TaxID=42354 RepID=A0A2T5HYW4_9PROT|nr:DUF4266 domain-containing protein [Nitrosomonas oligotropha]PTQ76779.1 uncharacterized protein DUF4266 [Nitrosomonas oligotropha]